MHIDETRIEHTGARTPEEVHALLAQAFNRGDIDAFVDVFEPDAAMVAPPTGAVVHGHDEIRRAVEPIFAFQARMDIEVVGKVQGREVALTHAHWQVVGVDRDGAPVDMAGRGTIVTRQRRDGTWRIALDNPLSPA